MSQPVDIPETMTAAVIDKTGPAENLHTATVPVPPSFLGDVLVKVAAAGINPVDFKTRSGKNPTAAALRFPAILGHDFAGTIVREPYEAHPLRAGTKVFGMTTLPRYAGSYAEYVAAPTLAVAPKPTSLSFTQAAAVPLAALTAWGAVVDVAKAHHGQRMLIHAGAGGVGQFAVQFARYFGADVVTTASGRNIEFLRSIGAKAVVDYTTTRFDEVLSDIDVVIDLMGNAHDDTGSRSLRVLRPDGLIVNVPTGSFPTLFEEADAAGVRATTFKLVASGDTLAKIGRIIDAGDVSVHVDAVYPLAEAAAAHAELEKGHTRGKIVLEVE
ncbi:NADPH:quinone reductase [Paramicrobacterium humi]|uniref:NADPH:quinone reductase n=1 Tax=Paramicrobacterium humi TaxID=640635 RepID=A0A1H4J8E5_9MICO|nr:NADP-dependent oxidoreductase [Microbacterium humi]SEB42619.1 NADPH:quinone reductase [Microbacterium humi]